VQKAKSAFDLLVSPISSQTTPLTAYNPNY
jgi:hypothetical protein